MAPLDLTSKNDGAFHGPDGALVVRDDGLLLTWGDVLICFEPPIRMLKDALYSLGDTPTLRDLLKHSISDKGARDASNFGIEFSHGRPACFIAVHGFFIATLSCR